MSNVPSAKKMRSVAEFFAKEGAPRTCSCLDDFTGHRGTSNLAIRFLVDEGVLVKLPWQMKASTGRLRTAYEVAPDWEEKMRSYERKVKQARYEKSLESIKANAKRRTVEGAHLQEIGFALASAGDKNAED